MTKIILLNAGGRHIKVIKDIILAQNDLELYAVIDPFIKQPIKKGNVIYANISFIENFSQSDFKFCISIGSNGVRKQTFENSNIPIERYHSLIHPSAVISKTAKIGYGTVVMPNAVINADTIIGNHCIINSNATIEHDCVIENYAHISPGVTLPGGVRVGKCAHIGSGASAIPEIRIGEGAIVGAGAVVINDIASNATAVGVPAKIIKS